MYSGLFYVVPGIALFGFLLFHHLVASPFSRWAAHNFTPFHPCPSHPSEICSPYNFFSEWKFFVHKITNLLRLFCLTLYVFINVHPIFVFTTNSLTHGTLLLFRIILGFLDTFWILLKLVLCLWAIHLTLATWEHRMFSHTTRILF